MKKLLAVVLSLSMLFCFAACGAKPAKEAPGAQDPGFVPGVPSPLTEYESLDALNAVLGTRLCSPGVMGVTDHVYQTIDCDDYMIAEYRFAVNGYDCVFRCAGVTTDISGIWSQDGTIFDHEFPGGEIEYAYTDEIKAARWFNTDGQYCFALTDAEGNMESETFEGIAEELKSLTASGTSDSEKQAVYDGLAGGWQDTFSQRAVAEITSGEGFAAIVVQWSSSAVEYTRWIMTVTMDEDGLLNYTDCRKAVISVENEDGEVTETVEYENGAGCFSYGEDGLLAWSGAEEESCVQCVFEKLPQ